MEACSKSQFLSWARSNAHLVIPDSFTQLPQRRGPCFLCVVVACSLNIDVTVLGVELLLTNNERSQENWLVILRNVARNIISIDQVVHPLASAPATRRESQAGWNRWWLQMAMFCWVPGSVLCSLLVD